MHEDMVFTYPHHRRMAITCKRLRNRELIQYKISTRNPSSITGYSNSYYRQNSSDVVMFMRFALTPTRASPERPVLSITAEIVSRGMPRLWTPPKLNPDLTPEPPRIIP